MKINKFENASEQVTALANHIELLIREILQKKPKVCLAVSGGKSPIPLFTKLSQYDLDWSRVTITLVDERFVANTHDDSNEKLITTYLLQNHAKSAHFIGLVKIESGLEQSLKIAESATPPIDIAILGMGEDGHTASIFPCAKELSVATNLQQNGSRYVITHPTTANYARLGLNLAAILNTPQLILSINGENKLTIMEKAIMANDKSLPVGLVLNQRPDTQIFWFK